MISSTPFLRITSCSCTISRENGKIEKEVAMIKREKMDTISEVEKKIVHHQKKVQA